MPDEIEAFERFCAALTLDSGRPMVLEPFQRTMLGDYFAGTRETVVLIPKKNAKTTTLAALALFHLLTTPEAECLIAAASRDQAQILFDAAAGFVKRSDGLQARLTVRRGYREIRRAAGGRIRVLAADADTADGVLPTLALVDELHRHRTVELYSVFRDGLGPRDGRMVTISTAGDTDESPLGVLRNRAYTLPMERDGAYHYAKSSDGAFVLHEWALEPGDDREDLELVKRANPASWHTVETLRERRDSPSTTDWTWARFACGVWVRGGVQQWLSPEAWALCEDKRPIPDGAEVVIGFDGSFRYDATAVVAVEIGETPHIDVVECWERQASDPEDWTVPIGLVEDTIRDAAKRWEVQEIAADPYRWERSLEALAEDRLPVVEFTQTPSRMVPATNRFTEAVGSRGLTHSGDPRLTRHVENAVLRQTTGGAQISKVSKGSTRRIDLAAAAIFAHERAAVYTPSTPAVVDMNRVLQDMVERGEGPGTPAWEGASL